MSAIAHRAAMLPLAASRDGTVYLVLDALRVVAVNTADGWMRDVTAASHASRDFVERAGAWEVVRAHAKWRRCRMVASSATTQAARRRKGSTRPGDAPSLVRHEMSVA